MLFAIDVHYKNQNMWQLAIQFLNFMSLFLLKLNNTDTNISGRITTTCSKNYCQIPLTIVQSIHTVILYLRQWAPHIFEVRKINYNKILLYILQYFHFPGLEGGRRKKYIFFYRLSSTHNLIPNLLNF